MKTKFRFITLLMLLVLGAVFNAAGQETTGSVDVTVKDPQGSYVPNATVLVESIGGTAGFRRTVTTGNQGVARFLQVPPGVYRIAVDPVSGFAAKTVDTVTVVLGKITQVNVDLGLAGAAAVVDVIDSASPIDTTDSKLQTNITTRTAELLPKGVGFSSLLKLSPATRPESKTGGFQVDGASGSENTFIIDGNEVTNPISGTLDSNNNLPFSIIQEVQIKSSGFEAEFGGATGGVVNVVTRGGNNEFRGEFGLHFSPSALQSPVRDTLYVDEAGDPIYLSYKNLEDRSGYFPLASFSGPIVKNRLWFLGSYSPQKTKIVRTIPYTELDPQTYTEHTTSDYAFGRIDAQPFDSLRVWSSYIWNPSYTTGAIPAMTSLYDSAYPSGLGLSGVPFMDQRGGRQNSNIFTISGVWTPTSNFIFDARYGRNFLNNKLGTYGLEPPLPGTATNVATTVSASSINIPAGTGATPGASNGIPWADGTVFDATSRETFDTAATFIGNWGGRHEFKGGLQYNKINNEVLAPRNLINTISYGFTVAQVSGRSITSTPGAIGAGRIRIYGATGEAGSTNTGFFFQDKWQPTRRLSLNLGVRFENEKVPSFNEFEGIEFGWGDKFAPRIGAAYDLTGDGKTKISGFFGWFYDRFKYELPRGSFGGNVYQSYYYELFDANQPFNQVSAPTILGSGIPPLFNGGNCPSTGFVVAQVRCVVDHRVPSNDPSLDVAFDGGIDPNILPYRQTELTFTFERELNDKYVLSARYVHKKLDRTIEDAGFINPEGSEAYIIGNPGLGLIKDFYVANNWIPVKARRDYDALEIRLDRRFADDYYFNANYTLSRLYGNYSGLASSDENGRTDPNVSRAFDAPFTEAQISGGETLGRLATDRPHVFKFAGAYSLDWNRRFGWGSNNTTEFMTFFTALSGTPLTTYAKVAGYDNIILNRRGDLGRTDFFTQTDFAVRHRYRFGKNERFTFVAEMDVINLFNQKATTNIYSLIDGEDYDLTEPANGLLTVPELRAPILYLADGVTIKCQENGAPGINPCAPGTGSLGDAYYGVAEGRFQAGGAPNIAAAIAAGAGLPESRFLRPNEFQGARTVRFGFRFLF